MLVLHLVRHLPIPNPHGTWEGCPNRPSYSEAKQLQRADAIQVSVPNNPLSWIPLQMYVGE